MGSRKDLKELIRMEEKTPLNERVKQILTENRRALYIGRVASDHKNLFIKIAEEKFDNDYGMLLQHLLDTYMVADAKYSKLSDTIESIIEWVKGIENKVNTLEQKPKREIKSVSGKVLTNERKEGGI